MSKQQHFVTNGPGGRLLNTNEDKTAQIAEKLLAMILPVVAEAVKEQLAIAGIKPGSTGSDMAANLAQYKLPSGDDGPGSNGRKMPSNDGSQWGGFMPPEAD